MTLWLYLHFPKLQLDTLFSESGQQPIAVIHKNHIVQLNNMAKTSGLKQGMGLGNAASLCNNLQVHPYKPDIEKQKLLEIAQWLYLITADISISPPSGLLLKVTNMLTLYDGLESYWQAVKTPLNKLNLEYYFSTGYSPYSARLLAQAQFNRISENKEKIEEQLKKYPLEATELTRKTIEKLNRVGVRNLGDLLMLDISEIARRFDIELVNYIGQLTGRFKHLVEFYYPPESFTQYLELLYEVDNFQWLEKPLQALFNQLERFLKLRDQVAYELILTLSQREESHEQQSIMFTSARGDYLADKWRELSQLTLESTKLNAPVTAITLSAKRVSQQQSDKLDLFDGPKGDIPDLELISRLQAKLGKEAIRGITLTSDPRPEKTTQLCQPLEHHSTEHKTRQIRPSILFPSPIPLREKISIVHGPERLVTGWWDAGEITRDYFIARSHQGRILWVFKTPKKRWFIHGVFS